MVRSIARVVSTRLYGLMLCVGYFCRMTLTAAAPESVYHCTAMTAVLKLASNYCMTNYVHQLTAFDAAIDTVVDGSYHCGCHPSGHVRLSIQLRLILTFVSLIFNPPRSTGLTHLIQCNGRFYRPA